MLVATDVAARGIDVNDISHVINYNLPDELEVYTHRTGRTGRAEKSGTAISIVNYREKNKIPSIEKIIDKKCEKMPIPSGDEICSKQLFNLIDKMENARVDEKQIAPFMETVNKKLEWLSKEEIIKHFVSLEFNRFLEYYKDAPNLNKKAEKKDNQNKKDKNNSRKAKQNGNYTRFFLNMGRKDALVPQKIIGLINDYTKDRGINIGEIDIKHSFSFFEVGEKYAPKVKNSMQDKKFKGRTIKLEVAEKREKKGRKKSGKTRK
jgi:ATP-dependent RNA helicase DeaD